MYIYIYIYIYIYMTYGDFKDLAKRTASDNILRDKAFNIVKNPKYDGYQRGRTSMAYKFFYKKASYSGIKSMLNQQNCSRPSQTNY